MKVVVWSLNAAEAIEQTTMGWVIDYGAPLVLHVDAVVKVDLGRLKAAATVLDIRQFKVKVVLAHVSLRSPRAKVMNILIGGVL